VRFLGRLRDPVTTEVEKLCNVVVAGHDSRSVARLDNLVRSQFEPYMFAEGAKCLGWTSRYTTPGQGLD
jgi:hypothetical protein